MSAMAREVKRLVVKVGTSILTSKSGHFSRPHVEKVSSEVLEVVKEGREVVLVSSGAIACGMDVLGLKARPRELPQLQACAAIGQGKLMKIYEDFFSRRDFHTAQVLLTRDGMEDRERYLNARNTLHALLRMGVLPIVNENDTVATEEIRFGDNDNLSAFVSSMVDADLLVILSDVEGFYLDGNRRLETVRSIDQIQQDLKGHLYRVDRAKTKGGMEAKLEAARFAMQAGVPMVIANGLEPEIVRKILRGESVGTYFQAWEKRRNLRKNWLAFSQTKGDIAVDEGARKAVVEQAKSLLPTGVVRVHGTFRMGDTVRLVDTKGHEIARGLVNYGHEELDKIKGQRTSRIPEILGYKYYDEVVHRDNLVVTSGERP